MSEEWRPIPGFVGLYEASSEGRIRSIAQRSGTSPGRIFKRGTNGARYHAIRLCGPTGHLNTRVHRVVALAFLGDPPSLAHEVNHKNGNKLDNRVGNLEWVTKGDNQRHSFRLGLRKPVRKLTLTQVCEIRALRGRMPQRAIANKYGVSQQAIMQIQTRKMWKESA